MSLKHFLTTSALVTLCTLSLSACGTHKQASNESKLAPKQVLNWSLQTEISTLDSAAVTESESADIVNNAMEGLYRVVNNKPKNGLATSCKSSADGLTYTLTLRKNAKWSNGEPVTAHDFVYAWRRMVDPQTHALGSYLFTGIKNADAIIAGKKAPSTLGIQADGDYKLVVQLDQKLPYFKLLMGDVYFFPQNKKTVEKYGKRYGTSATTTVYNGPFVVKGWNGSNLKWKLVKNHTYWDQKNVRLDTLNVNVVQSLSTAYNLYQANKLDFTYLNAEQGRQLADKPGYRVFHRARVSYMEFNEVKKEFKNQKIRQALSYAIDRKQISASVFGNNATPLTGIVPKNLMSFKGKDFSELARTKVGTSYNPKLARKLMAEGLRESNKDQLEFTLLSSDNENMKKEAELLQSQIEETLPQVKISVRNIPLKNVINQTLKGDFDVQLTGWLADFADPINFLDVEAKSSPTNVGKWDNSEYNQLLTAAKTTNALNPEKRIADLVKASKVLNQAQPVIPLVQLGEPEILRPTVHGLVQNTAGTTDDFKNVYITQ